MSTEKKSLEQLVLELQAHAREMGWQDYDEPIAALMAWKPVSPPDAGAPKRECDCLPDEPNLLDCPEHHLGRASAGSPAAPAADASQPAETPGRCIHGGLRRQCETCDLAERLEQAESALQAAQAENIELRSVIDTVRHEVAPLIENNAKIKSGLVALREERQAAQAEREALVSGIKELADYCDHPTRPHFRHRYKDDGVYYTPYRAIASKLTELLARLSPQEGKA